MMHPGLASWAKFSRPFGTKFLNREFTHTLFTFHVCWALTARLESCLIQSIQSGASQKARAFLSSLKDRPGLLRINTGRIASAPRKATLPNRGPRQFRFGPFPSVPEFP
jgi:hypothetical protein